MHFCQEKSSLTEFWTSLLCAFEQSGALHWNTLKTLLCPKRQNFYEFKKKKRIFRKLTTDFENHTKRQAATTECEVLDADY